MADKELTELEYLDTLYDFSIPSTVSTHIVNGRWACKVCYSLNSPPCRCGSEYFCDILCQISDGHGCPPPCSDVGQQTVKEAISFLPDEKHTGIKQKTNKQNKVQKESTDKKAIDDKAGTMGFSDYKQYTRNDMVAADWLLTVTKNTRGNYTETSKLAAIQRVNEGVPIRKVSEESNIPYATIWNWTKGKERRKTTNQFEKQYMDTEKVDVGRPINQGSKGLDSYSSKVTDDSFSYSCNCCGKIMARKDRMKEHIQTHFPRCEMCGVLCRDTPSLKVHMSRFHRSAV